jgi:hypothetical protein
MKPKDFQRLMERDKGCVHCGETEAVSPNHRINRGMGGSKLLDRPSNLVILCSRMNFLIEADASQAEIAKTYGWKLERWQKPEKEPVFNRMTHRWLLLDDEFGTKVIRAREGK